MFHCYYALIEITDPILSNTSHSHLDFIPAVQTIFDVKIEYQKLWRDLRFICSSLVTMRQDIQMMHRSIGNLVLLQHVTNNSTITNMHY